eukprot:jgi/Astpho2/1826/e_gw1.00038.20.1_t
MLRTCDALQAEFGGGPVTTDQEQQKWLAEAGASVKRNAFYMKKALDEDNLREALRYSAAMLGELRTSSLTPQKYFELYMQVFDELRHLEIFFKEEHKKGRQYKDLYELVQHAGNVLPRMYLLCTVGSCYIRSREAHAKDILKDLVELCKGVQHPTRGLFLRSYLCQVCKGLLPDEGSEYQEGGGGTIADAVDFLLVNFTEMNKLWVRMQHQGSIRDRERREKERLQLADLVGRNLTYLSQLEGLDFKLYQEGVLARMMEQILQCKDDIAQQYLMQCVIQGFPDEFHLGTLDALLGALPTLQAGVRIHIILASILDRLASYAEREKSVVESYNSADAFGKLSKAASDVAEKQQEMSGADLCAMYIALLGFIGKVYPDKLDNMDQVLTECHKASLGSAVVACLSSTPALNDAPMLLLQSLQNRNVASDVAAEKQLVALLSIPLDTYDTVTVLSLKAYPDVMSLLSPVTRRGMAVRIVQFVLKHNTLVTPVDKVTMLFGFIEPLLVDTVGAAQLDDEDFQEEQNLVARLVHQLRDPDTDVRYSTLVAARKRFAKGGPRRQRHTLPPVAFAALQLVGDIAARKGAGESPAASLLCLQVLQFVHGVVALLAEVPMAEVALQLFLQAAYAASEVAHRETLAYELFEQAFILYEEAIPDSKAEIMALQSIAGVLHRCHVFGRENRDILVHKATGYSAKLLKKADQCRAVCTCSHLYWQDEVNPPVRDAEGVMTCLKRALKIANAAQQQLAVALKAADTGPVLLFVEILNQYLYYFEERLPSITTSVLQSLLTLVSNEMANDNCKQDATLQKVYNNTLDHIRAQQAQEGEVGSRYQGLQLS